MDLKFCPKIWQGTPKHFTRVDIYPWMENIKHRSDIYCLFWSNWGYRSDLPQGFDFYIVSYHVENINLEWLERQSSILDGDILVLFPGKDYGFSIPRVHFISHVTWHQDLEKMIEWHGIQDVPDTKNFKYSAICNRVTQSKVWVTTKLLETARPQSLIYINNILDEKNVHHWAESGDPVLDSLTQCYRDKWADTKISDGFDQKHCAQRYSSNPWQEIYTDAALHFTNSSFHYSLMDTPDSPSYIYPGPDIDEKTLKCLLAGTAFVACGQFHVYNMLEELGMEFDYGFDLSWDQDPGNISRFRKICDLIDCLNGWSTQDIRQSTKKSSDHNREFIVKKGFFSACQDYNRRHVKRMIDILDSQ